jgi:hypothetical protein
MTMARVRRWVGAMACTCLAVGGAACSVESASDGVPPPVPPPNPIPPITGLGALTLRWTLDEVTDPNVCIMGNATTFDVIITTVGGAFAGEFQAPCTSFVATISTLVPAGYFASARLLDAVGTPRTTPIETPAFTIIPNSELVLDLDFPASSFF